MNARKTAKRILAGAMKRVLEDISVEMGFGGEINNEVTAEGQRRMDAGEPPFGPPAPPLEERAK